MEVRDEWRPYSSHPDVFSQYPFFRQHMYCTLKGRSVNNGLDAVTRTAEEYTSIRLALWDDVDRLVSQAHARAAGAALRPDERDGVSIRTKKPVVQSKRQGRKKTEPTIE